MAMTVYLSRPSSSGTIRLRSLNPKDPPLIDPNYLCNDTDLDTLIKGMKMAYAIGMSDVFRNKLNASLFATLYPGCEKFYTKSHSNVANQIPNDEYLVCVARLMTSSFKHPAGTCRMGDQHLFDSVVNARLKVKGIDGLRVIDASVMPQLVAGHLNAPTIMIAEKGADMIKEDLFN